MLVCVLRTSRFHERAYRSELWKCRDGLFQGFGTDVSVMRAHRLRIVADKLHDYALRNPGILEQAHGCMAE
jgi:hypothetical protein